MNDAVRYKIKYYKDYHQQRHVEFGVSLCRQIRQMINRIVEQNERNSQPININNLISIFPSKRKTISESSLRKCLDQILKVCYDFQNVI